MKRYVFVEAWRLYKLGEKHNLRDKKTFSDTLRRVWGIAKKLKKFDKDFIFYACK